ncbi:VCBS repeat-containing protein [Streptomyces adelaidensis]|uniref:VCBS repeat-containing protein n=1 Tax=Streptomyces adelaidensis TaxID=2796465 RepID=UPI001906C40D|nr:VCBS repeat-containing protein [Streptomyces adelaidensis]
MHRHSRRLATALVCLVATTALFTACSGGTGEGEESAQPSPSVPKSSSSPSKRAAGEVNRDDVNGDGHADVVVNGWYRAKPGLEWSRNRFVALAAATAAADGPDPGEAFRLKESLPELGPPISTGPIGQDQSTQFTGDLDDDGYADVVAGDMVYDADGDFVPEQHIHWGGPDSLAAVTELADDVLPAIATGDFDGDGALDLLTLARPSFSQSATEPQPATVLYGPLGRDGKPRATSTTDVGYGGWVSVAHTVVGDFDGDGRDDLVTKGVYDEEDARLEDGPPEGVTDATFYRGTAGTTGRAGSLKAAGSVPGVTGAGSLPLDTGDFDGDGHQDIIGRGQVGDRAVVVYGSAEGPGRGEARPGDLGKLKPGLAVAVGDVNGDGYDDLATNPRGEDRRIGQVVVVLGGEDGLDTTRTLTIDRYTIGLKGSPRTAGDRDRFGWDLYMADLDSDGQDELLIGTFGFTEPRKDSGYWILRGTPNGPSTSDRHFVRTKDFGSS